jgi:hypothetical protein
MKKLNILSGLILGCVISMPVMAVEIVRIENAKILKMISASDGKYGGCMILLDKNVKAANGLCPIYNWVSLDCDGKYNSKSGALANWSSAQMAFALDLTVSVKVSDDRVNDYCTSAYIRIEKTEK